MRISKCGLVTLLLVALVVFGAVLPAVEQELREGNVAVAFSPSFNLIDEAAEAHQRLLHFLMAVVPRLLRRRSQIRMPAIRQFLGAVVEPRVLLAGHQVMIDGRFQEVAGRIAFVIAAMGWTFT